jgi:16S rRNA processing protein RimM
VGRPHGLGGEVAVIFVSNRPERSAAGAVLSAGERDLEIEQSRPVPGHPGRFVVRFAGVNDRAGAEALRGTVLRAVPIDDPDALWVHDLVGAELVDGAGGRVLGVVAALVANPGGDLLELDGGALVPLAFVVSREPGRIVVDLPAGLFD